MINLTHTQQLLNKIKEQLSSQKNQNIDLKQNIFASNGIVLEIVSD